MRCIRTMEHQRIALSPVITIWLWLHIIPIMAKNVCRRLHITPITVVTVPVHHRVPPMIIVTVSVLAPHYADHGLSSTPPHTDDSRNRFAPHRRLLWQPISGYTPRLCFAPRHADDSRDSHYVVSHHTGKRDKTDWSWRHLIIVC